jgi:hypothetical protein
MLNRLPDPLFHLFVLFVTRFPVRRNQSKALADFKSLAILREDLDAIAVISPPGWEYPLQEKAEPDQDRSARNRDGPEHPTPWSSKWATAPVLKVVCHTSY